MLNCEIGAIGTLADVTTQTPIDPRRPVSAPTPEAPPKIHRVEIQWHAISYKTVAIYFVLFSVIVLAGVSLAYPNWSDIISKQVSKAIGNVEPESANLAVTQAKFVNLDGRVQVKKVNSVTWVDADYHTTLDKGDLIQTGGDGAARITFADGTEYTIKSETLVTVEENNVTRDHSNTAVRINTGSVDLRTSRFSSPDSSAAVSVEDATAYMTQNSRASVKNDPKENEHEITVATGSAEVRRGQEKIELTQWEKASFPAGGSIQTSNVLAPPGLVTPLNLSPIISENPKNAQVHFEWQSVQGAVSYTLRISTTTMFTKLAKEVKVTGTSADVTGLDAGEYFWNVNAVDAKKEVSEFSETFQFSLVAQGKVQEMLLQIEPPQVNGRVAELIGKTEPGAALIINGQPVANISPDGSFRHFTEPLEPGQHTITVIGSNRRGGTAKQQISIVVPK